MNDINNLDNEDLGLKGIFGERFHDETQGKAAGEDAKSKAPAAAKCEKKTGKAVHKPLDAQLEPVKPKPNQMDKLKACAKDALLYGGLSLLFFYWQQTGQMAITASMPCICACCVLAGLGVGRNAAGG